MVVLGGPVVIVDYDPSWRQQFELERGSMFKVLGRSDVSIDHIGSTAIPGMAATPIIDLLLGAPSDGEMKTCEVALQSMDYESIPIGENQDPVFHCMQKSDSTVPTHHVYIAIEGSQQWSRFLRLREFLLHHPESMADFADLKRRMAFQVASDHSVYAKSKHDFMQAIETLMENEENEPFSRS